MYLRRSRRSQYVGFHGTVVGPIVFLIMHYFSQETYMTLSKSAYSIGFFEILRMFTDGMDGWMGYQKFPSIFFILFGYREHVYTYLYISSEIVTIMDFKILCQVGGRGQKFQN